MRTRLVAISFVILLIAAFSATLFAAVGRNSVISDNPKGTETLSAEITVASYNIKIWNSSQEQASGIKAQLDEYGIELVGLQEVDNLSKRSDYTDFLAFMKNDVLKYSFFSPSMSRAYGGNYGIGVLSAYEPIERSNCILPYPELSNPAVSYLVESRVCSRVLVSVDGVRLAFYNAHLSFESEELRRPQFRKIIELMNADTEKNKILVGDFNADFAEYDFYFEGEYNLFNCEASPYVSFPGTGGRIDNIVYSKGIELLDGGMVESRNSDHNMLFARLKLTGSAD